MRKVTVRTLPSGNGVIGKVSTLFVFDGDVSVTIVLPVGVVIVTVILSTFVFLLGTETSTTMGDIPCANGITTEGFLSVKLTPVEPGLMCVGFVVDGAPTSIGLLVYCGLFIPCVSGHIIVVVIGAVVVSVCSVDFGDVAEGVDIVEGVVAENDGVDVDELLMSLVVVANVVEA